ncbi:unnamed protein product [Nippostrongylus brasiliensis]|uniref:Uncharacterized protein n=1 Tax=Nippostrongylus brasiliensis TaxID=27835 RepID=A0A0N4XYI8_NIPBR|nr:unnamed protein product [Nippostrongylus brasiliensis]
MFLEYFGSIVLLDVSKTLHPPIYTFRVISPFDATDEKRSILAFIFHIGLEQIGAKSSQFGGEKWKPTVGQ